MELNKQKSNICEISKKTFEIGSDQAISHGSKVQPPLEVDNAISITTSQLKANQPNNAIDTSITNTNKANLLEANVDNVREKKVWIPPQKRDPTVSKHELITRQVNSMLNKLTIEKFETITDKIATIVETTTSLDELRLIADLVLDKAVIEPDWSEMYADLCQILKWRAPHFESLGKSSFSTCLLSKIQHEYECMPRELQPYTTDDVSSQRLKKRLLGIVKIIGELFLRKMFGFKVINSLVIDLVISNDEPFEHFIECFLQLIYTSGYYIEQSSYNPALDMWFGRLTELMGRKVYSKRIKYVMQDVIDLRNSNWKKNLHRETAKALSELRYQVEAEDIVGGHHLAAQYGNIVTIGQRANISSNLAYGNYMRAQEALANERLKERSTTKPGLEKVDSLTFPQIDFKYSFVDAAPLDATSQNGSPMPFRPKVLPSVNDILLNLGVSSSQNSVQKKDKNVNEAALKNAKHNGSKLQNDLANKHGKHHKPKPTNASNSKSQIINSPDLTLKKEINRITTKSTPLENNNKTNKKNVIIKEHVQDDKSNRKTKQNSKVNDAQNHKTKTFKQNTNEKHLHNGNKNNPASKVANANANNSLNATLGAVSSLNVNGSSEKNGDSTLNGSNDTPLTSTKATNDTTLTCKNVNNNQRGVNNSKLASAAAKKHTNSSGIAVRRKKKPNFKGLDGDSGLPRIEDLTVSQ